MADDAPAFITRLEPQDEYTHVPDAASNYNESMYFNVFDPKTQVGGWFRIGNRPNEGYAEMSVCLYLPGGRVAFMFGRPKIANNDAMNAGGRDTADNIPGAELRIVPGMGHDLPPALYGIFVDTIWLAVARARIPAV